MESLPAPAAISQPPPIGGGGAGPSPSSSNAMSDGKFADKNKKALSESELLEIETQKMEQQLKALRETMARGKEHRSASGRTTTWQAGGYGAKGSLTSYAADVLAKKNAALQKSRYTGVVQEADNRRKKLESDLKGKALSSSELVHQYPQYSTAQSTKPEDNRRGSDNPNLSESSLARRASLQPPAGQQAGIGSRRGSEMSASANAISSRQPAPPQNRAPQNLTFRPPARMWRVPSALAPSQPPPSTGASSPPSACKSNPFGNIPPSRRSSEMYASTNRRASHIFGSETLTGRRPSEAIAVVAIPPTPPRDPDSARDYMISAAEEGRTDWVPGFSTSGSALTDPSDPSTTGNNGTALPSNTTPTLLDGHFDEEASHKSFTSALEEWRNERAAQKRIESPRDFKSANRRATVAVISGPKDPHLPPSQSAARTRRATNDQDMYLPTHHETSAALHRPRSGSLASFGQSLTNLTASLGMRFGMSSSTHASDSPTAHSTPDMYQLTLPTHQQNTSGESLRSSNTSSAPDLRGGRGDGVEDPEAGRRGYAGRHKGEGEFARGVQTNSTSTDPPPAHHPHPTQTALQTTQHAFSTSSNRLTYMERLLLDKYRAQETPPLPPPPPPASRSRSGSAPERPSAVARGGEWTGDLEVGDGDGVEIPATSTTTGPRHRTTSAASLMPPPPATAYRDPPPPPPNFSQPNLAPTGGWGSRSRQASRHFDLGNGNFTASAGPPPLSALGPPPTGGITAGGGGGVKAAVIVEDVTNREEQAIMEGAGVVECVRGDRVVVREPGE
ncbi:uncharacterized protein EV422DRAFT_564505 [Fimicolochytrium jonesii]|uniref:uncharacterized protein n=1 Tax=Fimicolochytrium jonesii TaxID=1396493 RepID=UPI0022FEEC66|nr:uncharacterized protein EV422DRAFT_564505 [Fimicolochytrium jonesii]KAI8825171.1 hypothetical protein EV422DRAFT_564505 [Fimicolochytrium jonesii]